MKISISPTQPPEDDYPVISLLLGEVAILTSVPASCSSKPGDVVFGGDYGGEGRVFFPKHSTWATRQCEYRYRKLRPGEKVIFEGE